MKEKALRLSQDLMEAQKRYNEMVAERDRWKESYYELMKTADALKGLLQASRNDSAHLQRELDFYLGE